MDQNEPGTEEDLSPQELAVLRFLAENEEGKMIPEDTIVVPGYSTQSIRSAVSWVIKKGFVDPESSEVLIYTLGEEGLRSLKDGLPEDLVYKYARKNGQVSLSELNNAMPADLVKIGITQLAKLGLRPSEGILKVDRETELEDEMQRRLQCLRSIMDCVL